MLLKLTLSLAVLLWEAACGLGDAASAAGDSARGPRELPDPSRLAGLGEEGDEEEDGDEAEGEEEEEAAEMLKKVILQPAVAVS